MTDRQALDAALARAGLHLGAEDYDRLLNNWSEFEEQSATLRLAEARYREPVVTYSPAPVIEADPAA